MDRHKSCKVCTVSMRDLTIQTFCAGGKGGQNQNHNQKGVRLIHPPSGARGESREYKSQLANKRAALRRLAQTQAFVTWAKIQAGIRSMDEETIHAKVDASLQPCNLTIETGGPGN